jgi:hypothetical protein
MLYIHIEVPLATNKCPGDGSRMCSVPDMGKAGSVEESKDTGLQGNDSKYGTIGRISSDRPFTVSPGTE